ncbi:lipase family protein [Cellulosimicrobium funkei]|uniref:lipase family protein n=1 Tax=Cellulosimicrobium TaxID=157920 RepID=UPI002807286F|nr:lipase family protein [Cellulosimicrobium sp. XJ-DQ-B-000]MDQ8042051.1 lipase family protein [Cellulosimicrobium sp. XJ-DQ-B-000]
MSRLVARTRATVTARDRVPPWAVITVGAVCVLLGAAVVLRPFASLALLVVAVVAGALVLGVAELADGAVDERTTAPGSGGPARPRGLRFARGGLFLALAVAVVLWPAPSIVVVALLVGASLVVAGLLDVLGGVRSAGIDRWSRVGLGAASVVLGLVALAWPDVTVLVVAVVFGVRLVVLGVRLVVAGVHRTRAPGRGEGAADLDAGLVEAPGPATTRPHGRGALAGAVLAVVAAGGLAVVSVGLHRAAPQVDAFYDPPASVPDEPGRLLRAEPFTREVPDGATAWRILYTTTRDEGRPAVASGLVVVPDAAASPSPVIAWAHGTTGSAQGCAPSVLDEPFESGAFYLLDDVLARGWALVATDYVGLGTEGPHPYLVGQGEARSVVDAVRAARELDGATLGEQTVVWGHSQGGHAALWTGAVAPGYAPDVPLAGVAALAPASDLTGLVAHLESVAGGSVFASFVVEAYDAIYPDSDVAGYVRPGARFVVREMASRCLSEPSALVSVAEALSMDQPLWTTDPTTGPLGERLAENVPTGPVAAPLLVAQGASDTLILPTAQEAYVGARCAAGQPVDYRTYQGRDHVGLVQAGSPAAADLVRWTEARLAGEPPTPTCAGG